jgi:soluble lytic murein transglycosylase-like protein
MDKMTDYLRLNRNFYQISKVAILTTACISSHLVGASYAHATSHAKCEQQILSAAAKHNIPAGILYSVGLTETGIKGSLHPFALNIEGKAVYAKSQSSALSHFISARKSGIRLIDLGCMQINYHYHKDEFSSVSAMLDPRQNVEYAAKFLARLKKRHQTWTMAVARYHAGPNNDPAQKRYVCRVISNLVATGYGQWTSAARTFCDT